MKKAACIAMPAALANASVCERRMRSQLLGSEDGVTKKLQGEDRGVSLGLRSTRLIST